MPAADNYCRFLPTKGRCNLDKTKCCLLIAIAMAVLIAAPSAFGQVRQIPLQVISNTPTITIGNGTADTTTTPTTGMRELTMDWTFGTVVGTYTGCTVQAVTAINGSSFLTLGAAKSVTVTTGTKNSWTMLEPVGTSVSSTAAQSFGQVTKFTFACSGGYGTSAPATINVQFSPVPTTSISTSISTVAIDQSVPGTTNAVFVTNGALETGGNIATINSNTAPLLVAGGGGYIRQDSTATMAKESGGNLATVAAGIGATTVDRCTTTDTTACTLVGLFKQNNFLLNSPGALPAGTNNIGNVFGAAVTTFETTALSGTAVTVVGSANTLVWGDCTNPDTSNFAYVQIFDSGSVTVGTTVNVDWIALPPLSTKQKVFNRAHSNSIKVAATTAINNGTNAVTAVHCDWGYRP